MLLRSNYYFVVQNSDDFKILEDTRKIEKEQLVLIKGSGVDLNEYAYCDPRAEKIVRLLFPSRMLRDKGVLEYIEAAKSIRNDVQDNALFILAGVCDEDNPAVIRADELTSILKDENGYIEWIGHQKNMFEVYKSSDIVVLPSYYREGIPKALIEATAVGRPIITTAMPGCRECVINGYNGLLIPPKNIAELARAMLTLIQDNNMRLEFGVNSRKLAEQQFSIERVIQETFSIYKTIMDHDNA